MESLVFKGNEGQPVTNSLLVAEKFGKQHKHVLDAIRRIESDIAQVSKKEHKPIFGLTYQTIKKPNGGHQDTPYYIMNRDGFSLLVMGFTGKQALAFKLDFISAFNRMEREISMIREAVSESRILSRSEIRGMVHEFVRQEIYGAGSEMVKSAPEEWRRCRHTAEGGLSVKDDTGAAEFFDKVIHNKDTRRVAYANACVLNAVRDKMKADTGSIIGRRGSLAYWSKMGKLLDDAYTEGWYHSLPQNPRRLCGRFYAYINDGYKSLVHRGLNNNNAGK